MAKVQKTGIIEALTAKALAGQVVTLGDVVDLAKLVDSNTIKTANTINKLTARIEKLEAPSRAQENATLEPYILMFGNLETRALRLPVHTQH